MMLKMNCMSYKNGEKTMAKHINADKLCEDLMTRWEIADKQKEKEIQSIMADIVVPIVVGQPAADVEAVVRCKDCKYFEVDTYITQNNYLECGDCNFHTVCLRKWGDDFCSRGERRNSE